MAGILQHLRSSTLDKRPNPGSMVDGQVAINYASGSPGLFFKDSAGALVKVGPVHVGSTAPNVSPASGGTAGNTRGEQWLDTSGGSYVMKIWDGSAWRTEAGEFVNTTGDIMTGALGMPPASAGSPTIYFSGDTDTGIYSPGANQLAISTGGTGRLFVDASGRVGIGTTSPLSNLVVSNGSNKNIEFQPGSTGYLFAYDRTAGDYLDLDIAGQIVRFSTDNGTERLRITSDGKIGIGTSSWTLNSVGTKMGVSLSGTSGDGIALFSGQNAANQYVAIGSQYDNANSNNGSQIRFGIDNLGDTFSMLAFATAGGGTPSEKMRITGDGKVGIGTSAPNYKLDVYCNEGDGLQIFENSSGNNRRLRLTQESGGVTYNATFSTVGNAHIWQVGNNENARIDSSGRLLVGTSASTGAYYDSASDWQGRFQVARSDQNAVASFSIWNSTASTYTNYGGVQLHLSACKSGTVGSHTSGALSSGDTIGSITFDASDGTNFRNSARIEAVVDGGVSTGDVPGRLVFSTTADGASSPTERMRIGQDGSVSIYSGGFARFKVSANSFFDTQNGIGMAFGTNAILPTDQSGNLTDNTKNIGNGGYRWATIYAGTGTINTSDVNLKQDIHDLEQAELNVAAAIKGLIKKFRFTDAVAAKGDDARIHVGVIAQEVEQAFVDEGLDPRRYALFCEDTLEDSSKRLGIRYDELLAFVIAAL